MAKETAEKKLLKLIESTQAQEATAEGQAPQRAREAQKVFDSVKGIGFASFSFPPFLQNILATLKTFVPFGNDPRRPAVPRELGLREVNQILLVGSILLAVFLVFDFLRGAKVSQQELEFGVDGAETSAVNDLIPEYRDLAEYIVAVSRRNIFQPFEAKVAETQSAMEEEVIKRISEQTKDLKLVGIAWLDTAESASAMIENITSGVTYFLRIGEKINDVTVDQIFADGVIVTFEGEQLEMRL